MAYAQPDQITKYDKYIQDEPVLMAAACNMGDVVALDASGHGILADATDATKLAVGFASKTVTSAQVSAGASAAKGTPAYDAASVTLLTRCVLRNVVAGGTAQTPGVRVYVSATATAGATTMVTQTTTAGHIVQPVGNIAADGFGIVGRIQDPIMKGQNSGNTTVTFG